jgi:hypothetical protein
MIEYDESRVERSDDDRAILNRASQSRALNLCPVCEVCLCLSAAEKLHPTGKSTLQAPDFRQKSCALSSLEIAD